MVNTIHAGRAGLAGSSTVVTIRSAGSSVGLRRRTHSAPSPARTYAGAHEPLELGGSAIGEDSLVLGEDDMISLGEDVDASAATQLKSDEGLRMRLGSEGRQRVYELHSIERAAKRMKEILCAC